MPKTTNETIKSVIQDWLSECETLEEIEITANYIGKEAQIQSNYVMANLIDKNWDAINECLKRAGVFK